MNIVSSQVVLGACQIASDGAVAKVQHFMHIVDERDEEGHVCVFTLPERGQVELYFVGEVDEVMPS